MKKLVSHSALFVALLLAPATVFGCNTKFYHRAGNSIHETRYERNCLTTARLELSGGRATKSFNSNKDSVDLLDLYGTHNLIKAAVGSLGNPGTSTYNFDLANLIALGGVSVANEIGLNYAGKYNTFEANIYLAQNLCNGFFVEANIPVKKLEIKDIVESNTATTTAGLQALGAGATAAWSNVTNDVTALLAVYSLDNTAASKTGLGDIMVNAGWTFNNDAIEGLDFLDTTIRVGVSVPSAKKRNEDKAFELALGHDGHLGIGTAFDLAIGMYDWFTLGAHVDGLFFLKKTKEMRMHTAAGGTGYFKLLKGNAKRDMGHIWSAGGHVKAENIFKGFSLSFGYLYTKKDNDTLTPENTSLFPTAAANDDAMLNGWMHHAITVAVEYDMAEEGRRFNPHFGAFYSRPVKGKYAYKTDMGGGCAGVNVAWDF